MSGALSFEAGARAWEADFTAPLLAWYGAHARVLPWRSEPTPYRVWVSEIMLQQTRVEPALPYFERFMRELPDVESLARCDPDRLNKLWEGLGYYTRARNLQKCARTLLERYGGEFPRTLAGMTKLPGIGEYTAGAILSIAFSLPVPAVDGNVMRVLARAGGCDADIALPQSKKVFSALVSRIIPPERPGDFNQALMDLGATVCRPGGEPLCGACPARGSCAARIAGLTDRLPRKGAKKARRAEERTVLLIVSPAGVLLRRRPASGLLAGMWEYPNVPGHLNRGEAARLTGAPLPSVVPLADARHIFTHLEWRMKGYLVRCAQASDPPDGYVWATPGALGARYALPSAFKTYTALLVRADGAF